MSNVRDIRCVLRPSAALRGHLGIMYPERGAPRTGSVAGVLDDLVKVDALARILTEAVRENTTADGRLDPADVGTHVVRAMLEDGGADRPRLDGMPVRDRAELEAKIADKMAAAALGRLLIEAFENVQEKDGKVNMRRAAVYVLRAMKEARIG